MFDSWKLLVFSLYLRLSARMSGASGAVTDCFFVPVAIFTGRYNQKLAIIASLING